MQDSALFFAQRATSPIGLASQDGFI
ncbi:hypothetical protein RO524_15960, partial [Pseudomonas aeruginosa]